MGFRVLTTTFSVAQIPEERCLGGNGNRPGVDGKLEWVRKRNTGWKLMGLHTILFYSFLWTFVSLPF